MGNFEAAVEMCLAEDKMAEAILLAIAGGPELLLRTQKKYFQRNKSNIGRVSGCIAQWVCAVPFSSAQSWWYLQGKGCMHPALAVATEKFSMFFFFVFVFRVTLSGLVLPFQGKLSAGGFLHCSLPFSFWLSFHTCRVHNRKGL